jgi:hypothetical protein
MISFWNSVGAAEDRLNRQVLEMAGLWDCWDGLVMT